MNQKALQRLRDKAGAARPLYTYIRKQIKKNYMDKIVCG